MEIKFELENLMIEKIDLNFKTVKEKPATGKQLWKIQHLALRHKKIIDTLIKTAKDNRLPYEFENDLEEWVELMNDPVSFPLTVDKASDMIKSYLQWEKSTMVYQKNRIQDELKRRSVQDAKK